MNAIVLLASVVVVQAAEWTTTEDLTQLWQLKKDGALSAAEWDRLKEAFLAQREAVAVSAAHLAARRELHGRELQQSTPDKVASASAWFKATNAALVFGPDADCSIKRQDTGLETECMLHAGGGLRIGEAAGAACSSAAHAGTIRWDPTNKKLQLCDGEAWGAVGSGGDGGVPVGPDATDCSAEIAGTLRWNVERCALDVCLGGGAEWSTLATGSTKGPLKSMAFTGNTSGGKYVMAGSATGLGITGANARTIAVWLKPSDTATRTHNIRYGGHHASRSDFGWGWGGSGSKVQIMLNGDDPDTSFVGVENVWALYTITYNNPTITMYVDTATWTTDRANLDTPQDTVQLGRSTAWNGYQYTGRWGQTAIWGRALSSLEVAALHAAGPGAYFKDVMDTTDLKLYYTFGNWDSKCELSSEWEDGLPNNADDHICDHSGRGYHGYMNNFESGTKPTVGSGDENLGATIDGTCT